MKTVLTKGEKLLFGLIGGLLLLLIAILAQFQVMTNNNGKMPILVSSVDSQVGNPETHFAFIDKEDINYFYLADIIPIGEGYMASLGDVVGFIGVFLIIVFGVLFVREKK